MHCWSRYLLWLVIALLGMGSMLSACGQKGPLYLPEETTQTVPAEQAQDEKPVIKE